MITESMKIPPRLLPDEFRKHHPLVSPSLPRSFFPPFTRSSKILCMAVRLPSSAQFPDFGHCFSSTPFFVLGKISPLDAHSPPSQAPFQTFVLFCFHSLCKDRRFLSFPPPPLDLSTALTCSRFPVQTPAPAGFPPSSFFLLSVPFPMQKPRLPFLSFFPIPFIKSRYKVGLVLAPRHLPSFPNFFLFCVFASQKFFFSSRVPPRFRTLFRSFVFYFSWLERPFLRSPLIGRLPILKNLRLPIPDVLEIVHGQK